MDKINISLLSAVSTLVATSSASTAMAAEPSKKATPERRPNVIFILMDDAGYGDFGCYGQTKTETPNIDALAARGIRFTDMYAGAPVSAPSRCTLLTGQHSGHAQIRANDEMKERGEVWSHLAMEANPELEGQFPMKGGTATLGTAMKSAGYHTGMVGKWGVGAPYTESVPNKMGFDFYYGCICQRLAQNYYPQFHYRNGEREYLDNPPIELGSRLDAGADPYDRESYKKFKGNVYSGDAFYKEVVDFVNRNKDEEFFLMWTTTVPHSCLMAPDEWVDYYVEKFGDEAPIYEGKGYLPVRYPKATYAAMISYFDYQVGKLVEELKRLGIYDNTIIMFTSDNGPTHNSYTSTSWFDCAHPFRSDKGWTKRSLHEGGIRMPFIVAWGDRLKPCVSKHIGYFPDVMPTVCEIAGVASPATDGVSFLPTILGKRQPEHKYLYWEFPPFRNERGWLSVRMGKWKGLVQNVHDGGTDMELFDIDNDCREEHNLAAKHPDVIAAMWNAIRESHTPIENPLFQLNITYPEKK